MKKNIDFTKMKMKEKRKKKKRSELRCKLSGRCIR